MGGWEGWGDGWVRGLVGGGMHRAFSSFKYYIHFVNKNTFYMKQCLPKFVILFKII